MELLQRRIEAVRRNHEAISDGRRLTNLRESRGAVSNVLKRRYALEGERFARVFEGDLNVLVELGEGDGDGFKRRSVGRHVRCLTFLL